MSQSIGLVRLGETIIGEWPFPGQFPELVTIENIVYRRSDNWVFPYSSIVRQYRQDTDWNSAHLMVFDDGHFEIDHIDDANPEKGHVFEHAINDVASTPLGASIVAVLITGISVAICAVILSKFR